MQLRTADISDANKLSEFAAFAFQQAYENNFDPEDLAIYLAENFTPEQMQREISEPAARFLILDDNDDIAGYIKLFHGEPPVGVVHENTVELVRIYADPDRIGQGLGAQLMQAAIELALSLGAASIWLAVWESNQAAIKFYKKWDFEKVGEQGFHMGGDLQNDWVMEKVL